jgi:Cysteine rich repeat
MTARAAAWTHPVLAAASPLHPSPEINMSSLAETLLSSLSPRTLAAFIVMAALAPPLAHAQTQPLQLRSEALAIVQVCHADYDRLCPGVVPGGGRVLACLQTHTTELGANCAQVLPRAQSLRDSATAAGVLPK